MTREEILSIEEYCAEHKVSHRKRLEELNIPFWHFYKAKKKYYWCPLIFFRLYKKFSGHQ